MLNRKAFVSIIAILCCTHAFGAASVRTVGKTPNTNGTPMRAGSLRTVSAGVPSSSVSQTVSSDVNRGVSMGRIATSTPGAGIGVKPKGLKGGSGLSSAALEELERQIDELTNKYNLLDNQYNRLNLDVSDASTLAVAAKEIGETNSTQMALKMNTGDFNAKFDERATLKDFAPKSYVQSYVIENAPTPDLQDYYTKREVDTALSGKIGVGSDFNNAFDARLSETSVEANISGLNTRLATTENRVVTLEENSTNIDSKIDAKIAPLATTNSLLELAEFVDSNTTSINALNTSVASKVNLSDLQSGYYNKTEMDSQMANIATAAVTEEQLANAVSGAMTNYYSKEEMDDFLSDKVNTDTLGGYYTQEEVNTFLNTKANAESVNGALSTLQSSLAGKADTETVNAAFATVNASLENKLESSDLGGYYTKEEIDSQINNLSLEGVSEEQLANAVESAMDDYYTEEEVDNLLAGKVDEDDLGELTGTVESLSGTVGEHSTAITELTTGLEAKASASALSELATTVGTLENNVAANTTALEGKADVTYVDTQVAAMSGLDSEAIQGIVEDYLGSTTFDFQEHIEAAAETYATKEELEEDIGTLATSIGTVSDTLGEFSETVTSALEGKLSKTEASETYATIEALNAKADADAVYSIEVADDTFVKQDELGDLDGLPDQVGTNTENIAALQEALEGKLDESALEDYYTQTQTNELLSDKANKESVETNTNNIASNANAITALQLGKANVADVYNKTSVNEKVSEALAQAKTYADEVLSTGSGEAANNLEQTINTAISTYSVSKTDFNQYKEEMTGTINTLATQEALNTLAGRVSANETSIQNLSTNKLDATTAASTYLTQSAASDTYLKKTDAASTYATKESVEANKNDITELSTTVTGHTTSIAELSESKADKNTVEGVATNVTNNTNSIAAINTVLGANDSEGLRAAVKDLQTNTATTAQVEEAKQAAMTYADGILTSGLCQGKRTVVEQEQVEDNNGNPVMRYSVFCADE